MLQLVSVHASPCGCAPPTRPCHKPMWECHRYQSQISKSDVKVTYCLAFLDLLSSRLLWKPLLSFLLNPAMLCCAVLCSALQCSTLLMGQQCCLNCWKQNLSSCTHRSQLLRTGKGSCAPACSVAHVASNCKIYQHKSMELCTSCKISPVPQRYVHSSMMQQHTR